MPRAYGKAKCSNLNLYNPCFCKEMREEERKIPERWGAATLVYSRKTTTEKEREREREEYHITDT